MVFSKRTDINIDSPEIRAFVAANQDVFRAAMNGLVEAAQNPEASSKEENIGCLLRATVAFAYGVCKTFSITPEAFAELMHFFDDAKIVGSNAPIPVIRKKQ